VPVADISANSPVCVGNALSFSSTVISGATYQWNGPNNYASALPDNLIPNSDTTMNGYYFLVVSSLGCNSNTDSVLLRVIPYPVFALGNDTSFCMGREITLSAPTGYDEYLWSTGSVNNSITVNTPGTYVLTITSFPDCRTTDDITIDVELCPPVVPNVFTANDDGYNDDFHITFEGGTPIDMEIFNRWGELIRKMSGAGMHWDGKNKNGNEVPEGTYYYIAHYIDNAGKIKTFTGFVELIR
jgi:gliding motility-associated-like protein